MTPPKLTALLHDHAGTIFLLFYKDPAFSFPF